MPSAVRDPRGDRAHAVAESDLVVAAGALWGRWCVGKTTNAPREAATTCARLCARGRSSSSTNSPPSESTPGSESTVSTWNGK